MIAYLLLPVMLMSLSFYIYSVYRCRLRTRVVSKAVTSLVFAAIAVVSCWAGNADRRYFGYILAALLICTFGDVFLEIARDDERGINYFIYSLSAFLVAHVAFLVLFCMLTGVYLADFIVTAVLVAAAVLAARLLRFDFLNMEGYVLVYTVVVTFMFVKSLSLTYGPLEFSMRNSLVGLGAGLFILSNALYSFTLFRRKKAHKCLPGVTAAVYYTGQTLIALSVLFAR